MGETWRKGKLLLDYLPQSELTSRDDAVGSFWRAFHSYLSQSSQAQSNLSTIFYDTIDYSENKFIEGNRQRITRDFSDYYFSFFGSRARAGTEREINKMMFLPVLIAGNFATYDDWMPEGEQTVNRVGFSIPTTSGNVQLVLARENGEYSILFGNEAQVKRHVLVSVHDGKKYVHPGALAFLVIDMLFAFKKKNQEGRIMSGSYIS